MDEQVLKFISEAIKGGYGIPIILWFLYDKWRDRRERNELEEKKRNGNYISWESMDKRIEVINGKLERHLEKEAGEEAKFAKLDAGHEHLKENIVDIKQTLREISERQQKAFDLITAMRDHILKDK